MDAKRPALMLPMGPRDVTSDRLKFLEKMKPSLEALGWCIGIQAVGDNLDGWADEIFPKIRALNGRITCHLPDVFNGRGDASRSPEEQLFALAEKVRQHRDTNGLELATMHLKPIALDEPGAEAGLERYNSPVEAGEMLEHIHWHVPLLRQLNDATGGILSIENVALTNFIQAGRRLPTYLTLRAGTWKDLRWLQKEAGVQVTFDNEHFFASRNLLFRQEDLEGVSRWSAEDLNQVTPEMGELYLLAGYWLVKDLPPLGFASQVMDTLITTTKPSLFHIGGAARDVDEEGRIATHLPLDISLRAHERLMHILLREIRLNKAIGAVVEVCGNLDPEKYDPWSPRIQDDEEAKRQTFLAVVAALKHLA